MQETEQQHQDSEEVYRMTGAVVLALADCGLETTRLRIAGFIRGELARTQAWSPEMETAMLSAIETLEIYPDQEVVERHRDGGDWVL